MSRLQLVVHIPFDDYQKAFEMKEALADWIRHSDPKPVLQIVGHVIRKGWCKNCGKAIQAQGELAPYSHPHIQSRYCDAGDTGSPSSPVAQLDTERGLVLA